MNQADHPWKQPQTEKGRRPGVFGPGNQPIKGEIPVETIRRAFEKSGLTKCEVARRLGWHKRVPDIHRLNQVLGVERTSTGQKRKRVTYETAVKLCEVLNASPFEMGI